MSCRVRSGHQQNYVTSSKMVAKVNTFATGLIQAVCAKTARLHVALRRNFSGLVSATDPVKSLKDSASLVVCTRKKIFGWGWRIFCE